MTVLATHEHPVTAIQQATNPIGAMIQSLIEAGNLAESAGAIEKLADVYLKMEAEQARKAFAQAKAEMQAELPKITANRSIPNKDGTVRSTFAAYEDIAERIAPYLTKHGFSVSFTMRIDNVGGKDRMCAICKLTHISGHSETNEFSVRVCSPPGASEAQADGSTRSYARRGALCDCLNIVVDHDNDARIEGDKISAEEAADLQRRVDALGDRAMFLKIAGVESFSEIRQGVMPALENMLQMKERAKKSPPTSATRQKFPETAGPSTAETSPTPAGAQKLPTEQTAGGGDGDTASQPQTSVIPPHGRTAKDWINDLILTHKPEAWTAKRARDSFHAADVSSWERLTPDRQDEKYRQLMDGSFPWK